MRPFQWRLTVRQKTDSLLIVLSNTCSCVVLCRLSAVARELRTCKGHRLQNDDKLRLSLFMNVLADDVYRCISISIPEWEHGGKSLLATTEVVHVLTCSMVQLALSLKKNHFLLTRSKSPFVIVHLPRLEYNTLRLCQARHLRPPDSCHLARLWKKFKPIKKNNNV